METVLLFVCLADRHSFKTPSSLEKQILYMAGLALKKIKLDPDNDEDTVKEKITSGGKDRLLRSSFMWRV